MEARQRVKLSLTNRSNGLISLAGYVPRSSKPAWNDTNTKDRRRIRQTHHSLPILKNTTASADSPSGGWSTWWSQRGARTRSHPELGRENPQRRWYCVSRRGRVGRRQVFQTQGNQLTPIHRNHPINAGWSSPVARQAHNLKVVSSNLAPATKLKRLLVEGPF